MNEPLKRTFHGCLTCRKRKVRCRGGSIPCANCSRMNITCHSSFETNLRVSVVSPGGKKDIPARPSPKKPSPSSQVSNVVPIISTPNSTSPGSNGDDSVFLPTSEAVAFPLSAAPIPYVAPSPTYDQFDPLLFTGSADHGLLGGWDFDFSLQPYPTDGFLFPNFAEDVPIDPSFAQAYPVYNDESPNTASSDNLSQEAPTAKQPLTEEWTPRRKKRPIPSAQNRAHSRNGPRPPFNYDNDAVYLRHYGNCVRGTFTTKDDSKWSYHSFIHDFIESTVPYNAFRLAVLAWTAKYFACGTTSSDEAWQGYYTQAKEEVSSLLKRSSSQQTQPAYEATATPVSTVIETAISATLFLCRTDVLNHDRAAIEHNLSTLRHAISQHTQPLHLSAFASRVLTWLCYLHVRISIFAPTPPADASTLLDTVARRCDYAAIMERSHVFMDEIFGDAYPAADHAEDVARIPDSLRLHDTFVLLAAILHFRSWAGTHPTASAPELRAGKIAAIAADIRRLEAELEGDLNSLEPTPQQQARASSPPPDPTLRPTLQRLTSYAAFQTAIILWERQRQPGQRTSSAARTAVSRILATALRIRASAGSEPHKILRSMLWPLPVFVAGIETTDGVYADWIRGFIEEVSGGGGKKRNGGGQSGGTGGREVLELMARVRERQDGLGRRVAVEEVVGEMGDGQKTFVF